MEPERRFESVPRDFSEAELAQMRNQLVVTLGEWQALREQKQQATSMINTQIKTVERAFLDLQAKLELGHELVDVEVVELMDKPKPGWKTVVPILDMDNVLREVPMSPKERQQQLFSDLPESESER